MASRIFEAVASYLGVSEEILASEEVRQIVSSQQRKPLNSLDAPVSALHLPSSTIEPSIVKTPSKIDLHLILESLGINERAWLVLELRAMQASTLKEIATEIGGVSKQSVSEIIRKAHEKVRRKLNSLTMFFDTFEERSKGVRKRLEDSTLDLQTLALALLPDPARSNVIADEKEEKK